MATFNFTVRATDNVGAYADRTFNLTVNNTIYDRFVVVGPIGLVRSVDGRNWNYESGMSGIGVQFGGGKWLVTTGTLTANPVIRTSADGTNWATVPITGNMNLTGHTFYGLSIAKYRNGAWIGFGYSYFSGNSTYGLHEFSSPDGIAWTRVATIATGIEASTVQNIYDFEVGPTGDVVAIYYPNIVAVRRSGATTYNTDYSTTSGLANATNGAGVAVKNYNGVWMIHSNYYVYTSVDATNWVQRVMNWPGNVSFGYGLLYLNGSVITMPHQSGYGYNYESVTAGRTWQTNPRGGSSTQPINVNNGWLRDSIVSVGGTTLNVTNNNIYYSFSVNDGTSWDVLSLPSVMQRASAAAARDGLL